MSDKNDDNNNINLGGFPPILFISNESKKKKRI